MYMINVFKARLLVMYYKARLLVMLDRKQASYTVKIVLIPYMTLYIERKMFRNIKHTFVLTFKVLILFPI